MYRRVVTVIQKILDLLTGLRKIRENIPRKEVVSDVFRERREFVRIWPPEIKAALTSTLSDVLCLHNVVRVPARISNPWTFAPVPPIRPTCVRFVGDPHIRFIAQSPGRGSSRYGDVSCLCVCRARSNEKYGECFRRITGSHRSTFRDLHLVARCYLDHNDIGTQRKYTWLVH